MSSFVDCKSEYREDLFHNARKTYTIDITIYKHVCNIHIPYTIQFIKKNTVYLFIPKT